MNTLLLTLHFIVTIALIGTVLIQRSEGGGLGIGSSQGMGSFMTGRGTANLLTRSTAVLAAIFMALSLALAIMNTGSIAGGNNDILANPPPAAKVETPAPATPAQTSPETAGATH